MRSLHLVLTPLLAALMLLVPGCQYASYDKPIRFYPDDPRPVSERVRHEGAYFIARRLDVGPVEKWNSELIQAVRGDRLGFREENGRLYAIAGERQIALGPVPEGTQYLCWATQEHRAGASLAEARALGSAVAAPFQFVAMGARGAGSILLALAGNDDDDDDDF